MARIDVTVSVSEHSYRLANCFAEIIDVVRVALADGWQPGMDIPIIVTQAIAKLASGLQGIDKIQGEYQVQEAMATALAYLLPAAKVGDKFLQEIPAQEVK